MKAKSLDCDIYGDSQNRSGFRLDANGTDRSTQPHPRTGTGRVVGSPIGESGNGGTTGCTSECRSDFTDDQGREDRGTSDSDRGTAGHGEDGDSDGNGEGFGRGHTFHNAVGE